MRHRTLFELTICANTRTGPLSPNAAFGAELGGYREQQQRPVAVCFWAAKFHSAAIEKQVCEFISPEWSSTFFMELASVLNVQNR